MVRPPLGLLIGPWGEMPGAKSPGRFSNSQALELRQIQGQLLYQWIRPAFFISPPAGGGYCTQCFAAIGKEHRGLPGHIVTRSCKQHEYQLQSWPPSLASPPHPPALLPPPRLSPASLPIPGDVQSTQFTSWGTWWAEVQLTKLDP